MNKKILGILLTIVIGLSFATIFASDVKADVVSYLTTSNNGLTWTTGTCSNATVLGAPVDDSDYIWGSDNTTTWYVATGDIEFNKTVTIVGDVNLILANNCNLTVNGRNYVNGVSDSEIGIFVCDPNSLTIYGQSKDVDTMGSLSVAGGKRTYDTYLTAIGVTNGQNEGANITINGGKIKVEGAANSMFDYAICCKNIYINGGNVIAHDGRNGSIFAKDLLKISNAEVNAKILSSENKIDIYDSNINVSNGISAPYDISISGEKTIINCSGENNGLYAYDDNSASITISGGKVTAKGTSTDPDEYVYGIKSCGSISITGGEVIAEGKDKAISASSITTSNNMLVIAGTDSSSAVMLQKTNEYVQALDTKKYVRIGPAVCYVDTNNNGSFDNNDEKEYISVQSAIDASGDEKTIVLIDDDVENVYVPATKNITLDLNGFVLKAGTGKDIVDTIDSNYNYVSKNNSVIIVRGNLTLVDSGSNTPHYYKYSKNRAWMLCDEATSSEKSAAKTIDEIDSSTVEDTIITVPGGVITGGKVSEIYYTMYYDSNEKRYAGTAQTGAGGVYVIGLNYKNGSKVSAGYLDIKGGNIIGNESIFISDEIPSGAGGGVFSLASNLTMSGGYILGNYSNSAGGGISCYVNSDINTVGSFVMTGGTITHNISDFAGGVNIAVNNVTVGGTAKIYGNTALDIGDNYVVLEDEPFALGTSTNGSDGNSVAKPANGMNIGITIVDAEDKSTAGAFTTNGSNNDIQYFFSDVDTYYVKYVTDHLELAEARVKIDKNIKYGNIVVDNQGANTEETVTITATPDSGYVLDKITVTDDDGGSISVTNNTFVMPSDTNKFPVTVSATFKLIPTSSTGYQTVKTCVE